MKNKSELGCCVAAVVAVAMFLSASIFMFYQVSRMDSVRAQALADAKTDPANQINIDVERIFYHQPGEFTFVAIENDELKFHHWRGCEITWKQDAKAGEPIRVEGSKFEKIFTVHLHNAKEIDSADWTRRNGKFNVEGNTSVVE